MDFEYFINKKKKKIKVRVCKSLQSKFLGLMFKSKSQPLLFVFNKNKRLSIHSFFCKPFTAIWLDEHKKATKIKEIKYWGFNFTGKGKYLLEIPKATTLK